MLLAAAGAARAASVFYIEGGGNGSGIGMSQYGAYGYALHGASYQAILAHYYQGTSLGTTNPSQIVRVLLQTGKSSFGAAGAAQGMLIATAQPAARTTARKAAAGPVTRRAAAHAAAPHQATINLQRGQTYSVSPAAAGSLALYDASGHQLGRFAAPLTITGPGPLNVIGLGPYHGALELRGDGAGGVQTVNAVDLEDYVRGVLAAEMPASWAGAALEAQAVAARTYAITTNVGATGYTLYSDTRSQVYRGISAQTPSTDAAVAATRGQVVTYNGVPAVTFFFASSGGYTESVQNVWPGATPEPWLRGVPDPYDGAGSDPYHHWGYQLTLPSAATALQGLVKGAFVGIQILRHGVSPRILQAAVVGTKGRSNVTGAELQERFRLLTTYASFTTISTVVAFAPPSPPTSTPRSGTGGAAARARLIGAFAPALRAVIAIIAPPRLKGTVFPAPPHGGAVLVQALIGGHRWRTVSSGQVSARGQYDVAVPGPGTFRIVYAGLDGPAVKVT